LVRAAALELERSARVLRQDAVGGGHALALGLAHLLDVVLEMRVACFLRYRVELGLGCVVAPGGAADQVANGCGGCVVGGRGLSDRARIGWVYFVAGRENAFRAEAICSRLTRRSSSRSDLVSIP
jgi:hypothetical protein